MSTKGQVWTIDFMLSILILVIALVIFGRTMINLSISGNEDVRPLLLEGRVISDSLISEGYPVDWNSSSVSKIGLTSDKRINQSKVSAFYSMTYSDAKTSFNIPFDFFVFMLGEDGNLISIDSSYGLGHNLVNATQDSVDLGGVEFDRLVKINRITIYDSKIVNLVVYLWD